MNQRKITSILAVIVGLLGSQTAMATLYELTIVNGSQMPLSPAVIYAKNGGEAAVAIGSAPSAGFIQLCQTGNRTMRMSELKANSTVQFITQTNAPVLPGESKTLVVDINDPELQSLHFETMYGKSKDICGIGTINSHSLVALKQHVTSEVLQKDNTLSTGAYVFEAKNIYHCTNAKDAISCLRELAVPNTGKARVQFFAGYSANLISSLETKYGSADVNSLLFPTSGAIQIKLKLKH